VAFSELLAADVTSTEAGSWRGNWPRRPLPVKLRLRPTAPLPSPSLTLLHKLLLCSRVAEYAAAFGQLQMLDGHKLAPRDLAGAEASWRFTPGTD
jgi:hypothetical protein